MPRAAGPSRPRVVIPLPTGLESLISMMSLRNAAAIVGVGSTSYTRGTDRSTLDLHLEAALKAIADAGLKPSDIDAVMPSAAAGRCSEDFISNLGLHNLAFTTT